MGKLLWILVYWLTFQKIKRQCVGLPSKFELSTLLVYYPHIHIKEPGQLKKINIIERREHDKIQEKTSNRGHRRIKPFT